MLVGHFFEIFDNVVKYTSNLKLELTYTHALSPKGKQQRHLRNSSETPTFYQNELAMSNTADVTGGKPITI
jgi:hypothetical protein